VRQRHASWKPSWLLQVCLLPHHHHQQLLLPLLQLLLPHLLPLKGYLLVQQPKVAELLPLMLEAVVVVVVVVVVVE